MSYYNYGGYNPYSNPYSQYGNQQFNMGQQVAQQPQQNYIPTYYVNGFEGAKAYPMQPNSTIFLKDSDSDLFFIKTSDSSCRCIIDKYKLVKFDEASNTQNKANFDISKYATKEDLVSLENRLLAKFGGVKDENN